MKLSIRLDESDWDALASLVTYLEVHGLCPTEEEFPAVMQARLTAHSVHHVVREWQQIQGEVGWNDHATVEERKSIWARHAESLEKEEG